jgi:hypothetical protein
VSIQRGYVEGRIAVKEAGQLEPERGPARVKGRTDAGLRSNARSGGALRAEDQLQALASMLMPM